MLDTVARPMWLSGIKNDDAIRLMTPIWWRTCISSGRVAGSISHTMLNLPLDMQATVSLTPKVSSTAGMAPPDRHRQSSLP
jgi:hypothetical protein